MSKIQFNLQDGFLNLLRKENIQVTVYLVNGYQLKGYVKGFDSYVVVLENEGKQQLVYKHALSTIMPARNVSLNQLQRTEEDTP